MRQSINTLTQSNRDLRETDRPYWSEIRCNPPAPIAPETDTASYGLSYAYQGMPLTDAHRHKRSACETATRVARTLRVKVRLWEIGPRGADGAQSLRCLAEIRPL